jgi:hypothetical protein
MATGTACRSIGGFVARGLMTHEMWGMGSKVVVAVVGANNFDVTAVVKKGTAGGADVGSGRGYSGRFVRCCTFHPGSAAEGGRVEGDAAEDVGHSGGSGDVPTGEITGEGGGTIKRERQRCHSLHIPCAQITGEGGGTRKREMQNCHSPHIPFAQITGEGGGTSKRFRQSCHSRHIPCAQITGEGGGTIKRVIQS